MKKRIQKLQAIEASGKWGNVEGVIVTPQIAHKLLNSVSCIVVATGNLRNICKSLA